MTCAAFRRYLGNNQLTGELPSELGKLTDLALMCARAASPKYEDF